ncbi:MAG: U32 family peptidase [Treponemataceae bacterium]|nr:U32 family peptidase [Treponemataceae bacterium]
MELLSPAGNIEKLRYAYAYGADAAYIGLKRFSLRVKADNFYEDEFKEITALKNQYPGRRLHCALNIAFHNRDIDHFLSEIDYFKAYPIDAFIVQDLGIVPILQKHFPNTELHLSTQASCMNREAVKMYRDIGFSRVVLGRETSLAEVKEIKDAVPEMELECFAHGAMCIAYSGRCLMSAYLTGRSAQGGFCSHTCRWNFQLAGRELDPHHILTAEEAKELAKNGTLALQEQERPGEYFPVFEGDDYTAILSSKDLCMVDHLADMKAAGVDSLKIEGRMKSLYYVAMTTRAYRKALDALDGKITAAEAEPYVNELYHAAHREFGTGFFYSREDADKTTVGESSSDYELIGTVGEELTATEAADILKAGDQRVAQFQQDLEAMHPAARKARDIDLAEHPDKIPHSASEKVDLTKGRLFRYSAMNRIDVGTEIEFVGPDIISVKDADFILINPEDGTLMNWVSHHHDCLIFTGKNINTNYIVRTKTADMR